MTWPRARSDPTGASLGFASALSRSGIDAPRRKARRVAAIQGTWPITAWLAQGRRVRSCRPGWQAPAPAGTWPCPAARSRNDNARCDGPARVSETANPHRNWRNKNASIAMPIGQTGRETQRTLGALSGSPELTNACGFRPSNVRLSPSASSNGSRPSKWAEIRPSRT